MSSTSSEPTGSPTAQDTPLPTSKINKAITSGAVAGVAIGCFVIGALLVGLIAFLLRRKRQPHRYPQQHLHPGDIALVEHGKYNRNTEASVSKARVVSNVDNLLPQPAEDHAIVGGFSKIRDGIKNHAQSYYHKSPISHEAVNEEALTELASATGITTATLKTFLLNPATRTPAIMILLSQLALSRCNSRIDGQYSFLPREISGLLAPAGAIGITTSQLALFSKWKTITGALLERQYGELPGSNDPRRVSIDQALAAVEPILTPFINPNIDEARRRNLESILSRTMKFAFLLFSQPGCFEFDFTQTGRADNLVVFPAMIQVLSDEAEPLSSPRVLREKEIMAGLGL
ncbi:hypothetical protein BJ875DRAFT_447371 [Amylocarpus encephaloides]|uniref:Uncharacterized protein n=1 Tax=Amylocarpus encephaloides TaxID=45428 RepID=A0A9P8CAA1_9HELO|nr:hypothetical protein BJ875DRAFT_447371 [Amylocarpus encephaloides]